MRKIIIAIDKKYNHNWDAVYAALSRKEKMTMEEVNQLLTDVNTEELITIIDPEYPECFKTLMKPPFILYKEDMDKIEAFAKFYQTNKDIWPSQLGQQPLNTAILNMASAELETTINELKDDFGKLTNAIQLLNQIRRDDYKEEADYESDYN